MKKLMFGLLLVFILVAPLITAWDFDNVRDYDKPNQEIKITNFFGFGDEIATIKLNTKLINSVPLGYTKVAEIEINATEDFKGMLNQIEFFDIRDNNKRIERVIDFKFKDGEEWIPISEYEFKIGEKVTIGFFTEVKRGDYIEWIPTYFGERIKEWAVWEESLSVGLLYYYNFNEVTGTIAKESVEGIKNITLYNTTNANWESGLIGNAIHLNGSVSDQFGNASIDGDDVSAFSWSIWLNSSDNVSQQYVLTHRDTGLSIRLLQIKSGLLQFSLPGGAYETIRYGIANDSKWHNIVVVGTENANKTIYYDGKKANYSTTGAFGINSHEFYLGGHWNTHDYSLIGRVDEFGYWNRTLTDNGCNVGDVCSGEIADLYNSGAGISYTHFFENSQTYENFTYSTAEENFIINISANGSQTITADFYYDGENKGTGTKAGDNIEMTFTKSVQIPATNGTKEFYWIIDYGGLPFNSGVFNHTVNNTEFNLCDVTDYYLNTTFLNLTFKDEETLVRMGGQIDTSTFVYWLGDGSITKQLIYSNLTNMSEYNFCFTPNESIMHNTRVIQYSATGYPQRKYDDDTDLTNIITHKTLYLLSSVDGIYSTVQVLDELGDQQPGTEVTVERQFSGVWTIIGKETTDSAGAVTFWLNPDYNHRFTFEKIGCGALTETIRPTQTTYTASLVCGVSEDIYISPIDGLKWSWFPNGGVIENREYNFSYQLVSSKGNIQNAKFEIRMQNGTTAANVSSPCTPSGCTLSTLYTPLAESNLKGLYFVDIGNGSILIEADAHWVTVNITKSGSGGLTFFQDFKFALDAMGDNDNTDDFNRLVTIFFILCVILSAANFYTGFDSTNPGSFLGFMTVIVFIGSICNGINGEGFFYFNNFTSVTWVNNYILLLLMIVITVGLFLRTNRRR